jgi:hypothetical protein
MRPDKDTETCAECGIYHGHADWCSQAAFTDDQVLALFELWLMDIDSEPIPDMPDAEAVVAGWGQS